MLSSGQAGGLLVNDIHSQLNEVRVADAVQVDSLEALQAAVRTARAQSLPVAIAGGRHAMGGQQFCNGGMLLDTRGLDRVLGFDAERGTIEVEAGIQWPGLIDYLAKTQAGRETQWGIAQKQTGADRLSIGGAIAANVHGRGLTMKPLIADLEAFVLVNADGDAVTCSRAENGDLFRLAAGGQVETCYRRFAEFLRLKGEHDPEERFQSDWYRHYKAMFEDAGPLARWRAPAEP